jgi:undecaprenyl-diphosphatase
MSETAQAIILGILQGLTEFLPISSSAHLILLPWLMGWKPLGLVFDVMLHAGTLLAVLVYFRRDWRELADAAWLRLKGRAEGENRPPLVEALVVGTLPAVVVVLLARHFIENYARVPIVTVFTLAGFGLLLAWSDHRSRGAKGVREIRIRDGLLVGMAQSLALVPGVSRSGITITAALLLGFSRRESARFSFLLAGPIIAMGAADGVLELLLSGDDGTGLPALVTGVVVSFVTGFLCIKYFLRFLESRGLLPFVIYRLALALVILWLSL